MRLNGKPKHVDKFDHGNTKLKLLRPWNTPTGSMTLASECGMDRWDDPEWDAPSKAPRIGIPFAVKRWWSRARIWVQRAVDRAWWHHNGCRPFCVRCGYVSEDRKDSPWCARCR